MSLCITWKMSSLTGFFGHIILGAAFWWKVRCYKNKAKAMSSGTADSGPPKLGNPNIESAPKRTL